MEIIVDQLGILTVIAPTSLHHTLVAATSIADLLEHAIGESSCETLAITDKSTGDRRTYVKTPKGWVLQPDDNHQR